MTQTVESILQVRPGNVVEIVHPSGLGVALISETGNEDTLTGYKLSRRDYTSIEKKSKWHTCDVLGIIPNVYGAVLDIKTEYGTGFIGVFNEYNTLSVEGRFELTINSDYYKKGEVINISRRPKTIDSVIKILQDYLHEVGDNQGAQIQQAKEAYKAVLVDLLRLN